jgi:serine/threonine-protein kinase
MPPTDELTRDYQPARAPGEGQPERIKVALIQGTSPHPTGEIQTVLRKRLRFIALLLTGGMAVCLLMMLLSPRIDWRHFAVYAFVFAVAFALAGTLWRRSLSFVQLRLIELLLFGIIVAFWTFIHGYVYPTLRLPNPPWWFGSVMASAVSLPWIFVILVYGIFIPNTGRRCAAVVGTASLIPLVISAATGLADGAGEGFGRASFYGVMVLWMATAVPVAIYGSHRIEVLRREALAARQLGQYRLKERLGAGGMGEVYLAEHVLLRRPCALKLIRPERAGDPLHLLRFEREVQATAALSHPNTVQVFDYGHAEDGTFYYAMEYLPGLNLEELVKRHGPLPPERVIHLLRQACGALHEAHAAGLIHRDIKPSNIITCQRGGLHDVAKLLDFGLVRSPDFSTGADNLTQEGAIAGTPAYMSPEQADSKVNLDARSDIYSLGAVAYYVLTGQPPFVRPTPLQTLIAHVYERPTPPDQLQADVPSDLQAVVLRCLEKDPAQRFADARSLDRALAGCQAAGGWTEERADAWWHDAMSSANGAQAVVEAPTRTA